MGVTDRVREAVAPLLDDLGLEIYDVEQGGAVLRITVDRPGGVDVESLALATRVVSRQLDHDDPIPGRYTLEVTSPGLERVLRVPEHYRRAVGSEVAVRTHPRDIGYRRLTGVLTAVDDEGIIVGVSEPATDPSEAPPGEYRLRYDEIERCRTVFRWGAPPKPSPSRQKPAGRSTRTKRKQGREGAAGEGSGREEKV